MAKAGGPDHTVLDVTRSYVRNSTFVLCARLHDSIRDYRPRLNNGRKFGIFELLSAKRIGEDRLGEGFELGKSFAASGPEGVGLVEDRGDPPLLIQRWQRNDRFLDDAV